MMFSMTDNITVTDIEAAVHVPAGTGTHVHHNRRFHGLVINGSTSDKNYHFSDGSIIHTPPNSVFYLPEHSSYTVEALTLGECWAINFYLDKPLQQSPFVISFRDHAPTLRLFKDATEIWTKRKPFTRLEITKNLYCIISHIIKEKLRTYTPSTTRQKIMPAENEIHQNYTNPDLSVSALSDLCGISNAYFRRIFNEIHAMSPKDYITKLRIDKAKALLESSQLSVAEIALACGYTDACYFSREFKKKVGISPSAYRA